MSAINSVDDLSNGQSDGEERDISGRQQQQQQLETKTAPGSEGKGESSVELPFWKKTLRQEERAIDRDELKKLEMRTRFLTNPRLDAERLALVLVPLSLLVVCYFCCCYKCCC